MEFYSSHVLNDINQNSNIGCASPSPPPIPVQLVTYHHHTTGHNFSEPESISRVESNDPTALSGGAFPTHSFQHRSRSSDCLINSSNPSRLLNSEDRSNRNNLSPSGRGTIAGQHQAQQQQYQPVSADQVQLSHLSGEDVTDPPLHHELQFQFEEIHSCPVTSDSIPRSSQLNLNLSDHLSDSILNIKDQPANNAAPTTTVTSHGNSIGLGSCYVDCSDFGKFSFQPSVVDQTLMGFEPGFNLREHRHSDKELDEERSNCSPIELSPFSPHPQQVARENQLQFQAHQQTCWQGFRSGSSTLEDDHSQQPLSPTEVTGIKSSSPHVTDPSNLYLHSAPLYRYSESGSIPPLAVDISQSPTMIRTGSTASEISTGSSVNSTGVNPIHVNPLSQPVSPQDDLFAPLTDPFHQTWWGNQNESPTVACLVTNIRSSMDPSLPNSADPDVGTRMPMMFPQSFKISNNPPDASAGVMHSSSSPYNLAPSNRPPHSLPYHLPNKTRRTSHRGNLANHPRTTPSKISSRPFLIEPDYSQLPTKRSRGRRPPISPDLGLPIPDGHLSIGLQSVPGGQAFDPNLNPNAETVKYCELTKTGKPKKIFICQVKGCGKCFKRSEHLKRHVRSIHTNDKPYNCPWMACMKSFSRHDNLNQHLRVHRVEDGGEVLNGVHIGSDGVLRSDLDESPVDPIVRGLRDVEVVDRFIIED